MPWINITDMERSHRLGKRQVGFNRKPRPIIVRFLSYSVRYSVFSRKNVLKVSRITIREHLIKLSVKLFQKVQENFGRNYVRMSHGKFSWVGTNDRRPVMHTKAVEELENETLKEVMHNNVYLFFLSLVSC